MRNDDIDIAAIRARIEAATPGPWRTAEGAKHLDEHTIFGRGGTRPNALTHVASVELGWRPEADAEFITHARTDLPALCDAYEALLARLNVGEEI